MRERGEEKQRQGIARVNALSRCWSCLITSYQLKGKRRDGGKEEERSEIGLWRELCSEASDCGDSEFLAELHPRPSCSLARFLPSPPSPAPSSSFSPDAIRLMKVDKACDRFSNIGDFR